MILDKMIEFKKILDEKNAPDFGRVIAITPVDAFDLSQELKRDLCVTSIEYSNLDKLQIALCSNNLPIANRLMPNVYGMEVIIE